MGGEIQQVEMKKVVMIGFGEDQEQNVESQNFLGISVNFICGYNTFIKKSKMNYV